MTSQSTAIESLLSYSATRWEVSASDESRIISLLRMDPSIDATLADLDRSGMLEALFSRVDSGKNPEILAQTLGGKVAVSGTGRVNPVLAKYPELHKTFNICSGLHQKLRTFGAISPGSAISSATLSSTAMPFTGSGATGVDPANGAWQERTIAGRSYKFSRSSSSEGSGGDEHTLSILVPAGERSIAVVHHIQTTDTPDFDDAWQIAETARLSHANR